MLMFKGIWSLLCMSWIIIGLLGQLGDTVYRGECQSEGYFKGVMSNSRLKNYVISTRDVHSLQDCVLACLSDERCSSYNFQVSGVPLHKCELNFKSRSSARPGSLVREDGYQYYEAIDSVKTQDLCKTASCLNGGTCKEDCSTLPFTQTICTCPSSFTGKFCEISKTGNFLLSYNTSAMDDHTSVAVTSGEDFNYLAVYVWVKPSSSKGVVFSYATDSNPREMALLFNETNVVLYLGGQVITFDISLPKNTWSHLCFILSDKAKLTFFYNSLPFQNTTTELPHEITIKGTGTLVPAFEQTSPGKVVMDSGSDLTITRLYVLDISGLEKFELLGVFNEPKFVRFISEPIRVDWKEFYQTSLNSNSSALISPSDEPDIGNYDLQFFGHPTVEIDIPYVPPMKTFVLAMWIRVNSHTTDAAIFGLGSEANMILMLKQHAKSDGYNFQTHTDGFRQFADAITNIRWFHMLWYWNSATGKLIFYKNGNQLHDGATDVVTNGILPEIINGAVFIGDRDFHGDITSLNLWSIEFSLNMIVALALNPGNAAGDLFSWKQVEKGYVLSAPSKCHNRPGQYDLIFPAKKDESIMNYISTRSSYTIDMKSITVAFWIKIPSSVDEFTLISYAVPSQVNEFSVHFGSTGIWVYLQGNRSFVPLILSSLVEKWQHFIIAYSSSSTNLYVYHNGEKILKTASSANSIISDAGFLVIGAQQSGYKTIHQLEFQFIGELSQLQIYRRLFSSYIVGTLAKRCWNTPGNLFEWVNMRRHVGGNVEIRNPSECIKVKNGET